MAQQGDIVLFQTDNDGNITVESGIVDMSGGLETAAYLSLFGGNEDDDGRDDNIFDWWGNLDENEKSRQYHSETQHLLQALPITTGNLQRIEAAATRDLAWFLDNNIASSVTVGVTILDLNRIKITIDIDAFGDESRFEYVENWKNLKEVIA